MGKSKNKQNGEQKVEAKVDTGNENKKVNSKKQEIILKVHMHCNGCADKVVNCLKGFEGVEQVKADLENDEVIVIGQKADPEMVRKRVQNKYSRNAELLSPKPKPKNVDAKEKKEPPKKEEPVKIVALKMFMHCEGCASDIKKNLLRMKGILNVEPDMGNSIVVVKGIFDPQKLVEKIAKRMGKHVELVKQQNGEDNKNNNRNNGNQDEKVIHFQYPPQYSPQHTYSTQIFSDENISSICSIL